MSSGKKRDYYDLLCISKNATLHQIKLAYRKLAKKHHPDRNKMDPKAKEKFIELQEVYEVLSNPEKRKEYDEFGFEGVELDLKIKSKGIRTNPLGDSNDLDFGNMFFYRVSQHFRKK
jgi:molecular chaperone DnaJ